MAFQAGGNVRFRGPGSLWKTSWRGKAPYTESCCIGSFGGGAQLYQEPGGALDIVPANGWFIGTAIKVPAIPASAETVLRNGTVIGEGWELAIDAGTDPTEDLTVRLTIGATSGEVVVTGYATLLAELQLLYGPDFAPWLRVFAYLYPPGSILGGANGSFAMRVEGFGAPSIGGVIPLPAPYVNSSPDLFVGLTLEDPSCIMGLVGGDGIIGDGSDTMDTVATEWMAAVGPFTVVSTYLDAAYEIVAVPDVTGLGNLTNTNGWRPDRGSPGVAPNPLEPFIGAVDLVYAIDPGPDLRIDCDSPTIFYIETVSG